ncbi:hypothetical protein [Streptomyces sp. NPDC020742]|uniref:YqeB family protein n=1 Tax=unclassified Streptomyces TaxID=2593676 RepID=UPI0033DE8DC6
MTEQPNTHAGEPTELGPTPGDRIFLCAILLVAGAGLGWLVDLLADWLVTLPWAPLQGPAKLITSVPQPGRTIGLIVLGGLIGVVGALLIQHGELKVRLEGEMIELKRGDQAQRVSRAQVASAFLDEKHLVLLGHQGGELAREKCDLGAEKLAPAFTGHGYRWVDQDPHRTAFRPWVPETPDLPAGANALLKAREKAVKKSDTGEEQRELRAELARLGVVVRDSKGRQYWRPDNAAP